MKQNAVDRTLRGRGSPLFPLRSSSFYFCFSLNGHSRSQCMSLDRSSPAPNTQRVESKFKIKRENVMEGAAYRLVLPLTLLVLVPVAAAAVVDTEVGYADVVGNKHKHESETKKASNIADFDAVWRQRAKEAQKAALEAYNPHPEKVTNSLNKKVKG